MTAARSAQMRRNFLLAACGMAVLAGCGGGGGGGEKVRQPDVPVTPVTPVSNGPAGVTQADNAKVDQYLQDEMTKQAIPAVSLAVLREGRVVYAKAYGYSVATSQPAKPEDRFEIGSITKSFTASAVMLLVEEGKLSLDDKIEKHLGPLPASWSAITLRHLLSHTSGLPRDPDPAFFTALKNNQSFSEDEMLARFKTYAPLTAPGSIAWVKLGQPDPESNLSSLSNSGLAQPAQRYTPSALLLSYLPAKARSVPASRST